MKKYKKTELYDGTGSAERTGIVMIRQLDGLYRLDHAVTAPQKTILSAFGLSENTLYEAYSHNDRSLDEILAFIEGRYDDIDW